MCWWGILALNEESLPSNNNKKKDEGKKWQKKWPNCQMGMLSDFSQLAK